MEILPIPRVAQCWYKNFIYFLVFVSQHGLGFSHFLVLILVLIVPFWSQHDGEGLIQHQGEIAWHSPTWRISRWLLLRWGFRIQPRPAQYCKHLLSAFKYWDCRCANTCCSMKQLLMTLSDNDSTRKMRKHLLYGLWAWILAYVILMALSNS